MMVGLRTKQYAGLSVLRLCASELFDPFSHDVMVLTAIVVSLLHRPFDPDQTMQGRFFVFPDLELLGRPIWAGCADMEISELANAGPSAKPGSAS